MPRKVVRGRDGTCKERVLTVREANAGGCGQHCSTKNKEGLFETDKDVMFIAAYDIMSPYNSNYWKVTQHGYGAEII